MEDSATISPETNWARLDPRSLALVRFGLGLFVVLTALGLFPGVEDFFTDAGVLPRAVLVDSPFADLWVSFHLGSGGWRAQAVLTVLTAGFGVGLALGWRTRLMVLGCWVLLNSAQARNPFLFDRGDLELTLVLFWGFFLPLGGCWSLDARAGRRPVGSAVGWPAAAMVSQFGMIYLFAAYFKNGPFWLNRGDGLYHSLISPLFSTDLSLWMATLSPALLRTGNYAVVAGELLVALLLFCPFSVGLLRLVAWGMLVLFHLAVGLLFGLGLFPWIGAVLPAALVPAEGWESAPGRRLEGWLDRLWGEGRLEEEAPSAAVRRLRGAFLALCMALALVANLLVLPPLRGWMLPRPLQMMSDGLRLGQHWELFSPVPPYYGHFVLTVEKDGARQVVFEGPPTREEPELSPFPSHRWRMLMITSLYPEFEAVRPGLVRRLLLKAGLSETELKAARLEFHVRVPEPDGKWKEPEIWSLYRGAP